MVPYLHLNLELKKEWGKTTHKFTCKFKVFLHTNAISTFNAYSILHGKCELLLYIVFEMCGNVGLYIVSMTTCSLEMCV